VAVLPWAANPGDIIIADWSGNGNGAQMNHEVVVTKVTTTNVYISEHTSNEPNLSFFGATGSFLSRAAAAGHSHPSFWILHIKSSY
jgi:hypothetical protein